MRYDRDDVLQEHSVKLMLILAMFLLINFHRLHNSGRPTCISSSSPNCQSKQSSSCGELKHATHVV